MLKDEYVSEQIELLSRLLQTLLFPNASGKFKLTDYNFEGTILEVQLELSRLIEENKFNQAEDFLFDVYENDKGQEVLQLAVWFYDKLNKIDEQTLLENNFSHDEVLEGIKEIEYLAGC